MHEEKYHQIQAKILCNEKPTKKPDHGKTTTPCNDSSFSKNKNTINLAMSIHGQSIPKTITIQSITKNNQTRPRTTNAEKQKKNTRCHTCCSFSRKAASSVSTLTAAARSMSRTRNESSQ
jgi:hypothetical protein